MKISFHTLQHVFAVFFVVAAITGCSNREDRRRQFTETEMIKLKEVVTTVGALLGFDHKNVDVEIFAKGKSLAEKNIGIMDPRWIKEGAFYDAWGNAYELSVETESKVFTIRSLGADGISGSGDDLTKTFVSPNKKRW